MAPLRVNVLISAALGMFIPAAVANPVSLNTMDLFKREPPPALASCATEGDLKWQPVMDFDTDSCYNVPAVGPEGQLSEGMDRCNTCAECGCRDESDLDNSQVYVRTRCNNGWCGHMYAYYFEKDVAYENSCVAGGGHRHDWEHVVVWVQNDEIRYVSVTAHGEWYRYNINDVRMQDTHPKIVYDKDDVRTHAFRFGKQHDDDLIENHKGEWFQGALMSWNGFPDNSIRDAMTGNDWGSATLELQESRFADSLENAKAGMDEIAMDTKIDDASSPGDPAC